MFFKFSSYLFFFLRPLSGVVGKLLYTLIYKIVINIYASNIGALQYVKQILTTTKGKIDSNTITVGNLNTPLSSMDQSSRQKINNGTRP